MKKNILNSLLLGGLVLSMVFSTALPALASNDDNSKKEKMKSFRNEERSLSKISRDTDKENEDLLRVGGQAFNNSFRQARETFNKEMKEAKKVYKQEKKTAHNALRASIKSAKSNQSELSSAFNTYRNTLVLSLEKMSRAEQAAYNKFITALRNLTFTPNTNNAPVSNNHSVKTRVNTALAMTLGGSDFDGCSAQNFTYSIENPANGTVSSTSGTASCVDGKISFGITYSPKQGFSGNDSFRFRLSDGNQTGSWATVSVSVVSSLSVDSVN